MPGSGGSEVSLDGALHDLNLSDYDDSDGWVTTLNTRTTVTDEQSAPTADSLFTTSEHSDEFNDDEFEFSDEEVKVLKEEEKQVEGEVGEKEVKEEGELESSSFHSVVESKSELEQSGSNTELTTETSTKEYGPQGNKEDYLKKKAYIRMKRLLRDFGRCKKYPYNPRARTRLRYRYINYPTRLSWTDTFIAWSLQQLPQPYKETVYNPYGVDIWPYFIEDDNTQFTDVLDTTMKTTR